MKYERKTNSDTARAMKESGNTSNPYYIWLAEAEDKIEDGTLVELPCKVGDTIFVVRQDYTLTREGKTIDDSYIDKLEVTAILFDCTTIRIYHNAFVNEDDYTSIEHIGKWAFFTQAEAEKKLAELKGEK